MLELGINFNFTIFHEIFIARVSHFQFCLFIAPCQLVLHVIYIYMYLTLHLAMWSFSYSFRYVTTYKYWWNHYETYCLYISNPM